MKQIGYVIVREDLDAPLVQSQCIDVIENINSEWAEGSVRIVWFYRADYPFRKKNRKLKELKDVLSNRGIKANFIPFVALRLPLKWGLLPFVLPQMLLGVFYLRATAGLTTLHCRSYHAGALALFASYVLRIQYIFDPRSPFPEENVAAGTWHAKSTNFRLWKWLEKKIISRAHKTVVVTDSLYESYSPLPPRERITVIPNNYPKSFDIATQRIHNNELPKYLFGYVGSFGNWNQPDLYMKLLATVRPALAGLRSMLFIVSNAQLSGIASAAERYGVDRRSFDVVSLPQRDVPAYLDRCLCGVYLMDNYDPRLGVKTVEYLRLGLPVLVSAQIKGAASLVRSNNLGFVWDNRKCSADAVSAWLATLSFGGHTRSNRCKEYAMTHFSPGSVARQLIAVYDVMCRK